MHDRIYLDNNATTPLDPQVLEEMLKELSSSPKNPSSSHYFGMEAQKLLIDARLKIAQFLKIKPSEIIFTSGGTESMNLLIRGSLNTFKKGHIITTDLEHPCVYQTLLHLESQGYDVTRISPGKWGAPLPQDIEHVIKSHTKLIVLSAVNSETGVKLDLEGVANIARSRNIPLIIDGVALLGKESINIPPGVTGMGFSAHKIHGPKGVGFAFLRQGCRLNPLLLGGHQERGFRGGTENLSGIVGLASAVSILDKDLEAFSNHLLFLRNLFEEELIKKIPDMIINGEGPRVSNTSNIYFPNIDGETLLIQLDMCKIAASQGSACSSGALEPSRVLLNMGLSKEQVQSSLRFSFSRMNTENEIKRAADQIADRVNSLYAMSMRC